MSDSTPTATLISKAPENGQRGCYQVEILVPGQPARTVELSAGKCTIGSSPSCQIRLEGEAVRPLHCLLVATPDSLTATQWASGVYFNGQEFSSTSLTLGDYLTIGEVRLCIAQIPLIEQPLTTEEEQLGVPGSEEYPDRILDEEDDSDFRSSTTISDPVDIVDRIEESLQEIDDTAGNLQSGLSISVARRRCRKLIANLRQIKNVRSELEKEIDELNEQLLKSRMESDSMQQKMTELEASSQDANVQHAAEVERLIEELSASFTKSGELENYLSEITGKCQKFEEATQTLTQELEELKSTLGEAREENEDLQTRIEAKQTRIVELEQEHGEALEAAKAAQNTFAEHSQVWEALTAEFSTLQAEHDRLRTEYDKLQESRGDEQTVREELETALSEKQESIECLKAELDSRELQQSTLEEQLQDLCSKREELEAKQAKLQETVSAKQHELDNTKQVVLGMEETHKHLEKSVAEQAARFVEMEQAVELLQSERDSLIEQKKVFELQIAQTEKEIELLRIDAKSAAADRQQSLEELNKARNSQKAAEERSAELESELEQLRENSSVETPPAEESSEEISRLQSDLDSHKRLLTEAAGELDKLRESACHFDSDRSLLADSINTRDERITELEAALLHTQNQLAECAFQAEQLNKAYEESLQELSLHQQVSESALESAPVAEAIAGEHEETGWGSPASVESNASLEEPSISRSSASEDHSSEPQEESSNKSASAEEFDWSVQKREPDPGVERNMHSAVEMPDEQVSTLVEEEQTATDFKDAKETEPVKSEAYDEDWEANFANSVRSFYEEEAPDELSAAQKLEGESDSITDSEEKTESHVEAEPQAEEEFQPASFIDQFSHMFEEEAGDGISSTQGPSTAKAQLLEPHPSGDDDAALDEYMSNLMRRVRGESSTETITPPVQKCEPVEKPQDPVRHMEELSSRVSNSSIEVCTEVENPLELEDLKQFSKKPPLTADLRAMRELANSSARTAIAKHRKRRYLEGALGKFMVSGIAGGAAALMTLTAESYSSPYFLGGCAVGVVSVFWGVKLLGVLLEAIRDASARKSAPSELADSSAPLPIDV